MRIYFSSDLHFNHDREFIYKVRGFSSIEEMNNTIVSNFNAIINNEDDLYILGDLLLGGPQSDGIKYIEQLNGKIHIIRGNHDTDRRIELYKELPNIVEVVDAKYIKIKKYHFFLCHFPTMTGNLEKESLKQCTINLYGHTHQISNFYNDIPFMYHVGVDSHNCKPIAIEDIIDDMKNKIEECKEEL